MSESTEEVAESLRWIARQVRVAGDMKLERFDGEGVHDHNITLADWLWLLALELDPDQALRNR